MLRILFVCLVISAACAQQTSSPSPLDLVKQAQKLSSEGKQDEALALYSEAIAAIPSLFEAQLGAGIALDLKGNYSGARQHLAKAIDLASPDNKAQALRSMAMSYAFEGEAGKAAKYEKLVFDDRVLANEYPTAAGIANELARVYLESGDTAHAYKWYEKGYKTAMKTKNLSEADKNLWLFRWENAQARIAARRGQASEAQKHIIAAKAALDLANNPEQARFWPYLTGYVAYYLGDYKTAIADLQRADQRDPLNLVLLGEAYEESGDKAQAMKYYRRVLASNAHNPTNAFARPLAKRKLAEEN